MRLTGFVRRGHDVKYIVCMTMEVMEQLDQNVNDVDAAVVDKGLGDWEN